MQDANEFLTRILDSIKVEIDEEINNSPSVSPKHCTESFSSPTQTEMSSNLQKSLVINSNEKIGKEESNLEDNSIFCVNPVKTNFEFELLESYRCLGYVFIIILRLIQ